MPQTDANPIDAAAVAWVSHLDKGELSAQEHAEFRSWLEADIRHKGAYFRAKAAWQRFDRLQILASASEQSKPNLLRGTSRRQVLISGGAALAAAALTTSAITGLKGRHKAVRQGSPNPVVTAEEISTTLGEVSRVPLSDGSLIAINTDSLLKVSIEKIVRTITLDRGEAWFQVAKDENRPFIVSSGAIYVKAIGTAFAVRRRDYGADVLVTEGVVETWSDTYSQHKSYVRAGAKVFVSDLSGPSRVVVGKETIDHALAWRSGEIVLDGQSLSDAATEFNRYNPRTVTVDPALAQERLVGLFHINDIEAFARAAAAASNAVVIEDAHEIHIAPRRVR